ncbi:hypothetical protein TSAR_011789 [Trichomalopsis sarcophagae]|uniref:Uncharacterized protein n=1 Tax=Trichomalopsis sarcophagae TaxID=543379 RepID=A0A232EW91_9HYME|nr:hypothetical protein TSAR_011789 [Trichomalopsis sarcophagae]
MLGVFAGIRRYFYFSDPLCAVRSCKFLVLLTAVVLTSYVYLLFDLSCFGCYNSQQTFVAVLVHPAEF